jgi:hypothetical protein
MKPASDETYLRMLGDMLNQQDITGEILLAERAILFLDIHQREVSKDINTSFGPGKELRQAAHILAEQEGLPLHWLQQAIERCFPERTPSTGAIYPGLHIYVAPLGYLLTMFILFRKQVDDETIRELAKTLNLSTPEKMFSLVKTYLPEQNIPSQIPKNIEQLFTLWYPPTTKVIYNVERSDNG